MKWMSLVIALTLTGCVSQTTTIGDDETCVESKAVLFNSIKCKSNEDEE